MSASSLKTWLDLINIVREKKSKNPFCSNMGVMGEGRYLPICFNENTYLSVIIDYLYPYFVNFSLWYLTKDVSMHSGQVIWSRDSSTKGGLERFLSVKTLFFCFTNLFTLHIGLSTI